MTRSLAMEYGPRQVRVNSVVETVLVVQSAHLSRKDGYTVALAASRKITDKLIALRRVEALKSATTIYVPANWTAFGNLGK